ncbi:hypothetical protein E3I18_00620 [Candidatus Woesebacteria bacterium]|nr:MAG: hypothetical protein E3I18_00620 [Candidatus Woesebacteria bacterium]
MPEEPSAPTVSQTVTTTGGNNKIRKVALIVLTIVFLVIISEAGYLVFSKEGGLFSRKTEEAQTEQRPSVLITPTAPPPSLPKEEIKSITIDSEKARRLADMLDRFETSNKLDLFEEAITSFTITGAVIGARFEKKEVEGIEFVYLLQVQGQTGSTATYWFTDQEILNAQVSLSTGTGTSKISITDIGPGDNITLKETANLLDSSPHSSLILEVRR